MFGNEEREKESNNGLDSDVLHIVQRAERPMQITVNTLSWPPIRRVRAATAPIMKVHTSRKSPSPPPYSIDDEQKRKRHRNIQP